LSSISRSRSRDREDKKSHRSSSSSKDRKHSSSKSHRSSKDKDRHRSSKDDRDKERSSKHRHDEKKTSEEKGDSIQAEVKPEIKTEKPDLPTPRPPVLTQVKADGEGKKPLFDVSSLLSNIKATKAALQQTQKTLQQKTDGPQKLESQQKRLVELKQKEKETKEQNEKLKSIEEIQSKINKKLAQMRVQGKISAPSSSIAMPGGKAFMPPPLLLDQEGREVDRTGRLVSTGPKALVATTMINKRVQREKVFKLEKPTVETDPSKNPYFDPRMKLPKASRIRRGFKFVDAGTYIKKGARMRTKLAKQILTNTSAAIAEQEEGGGALGFLGRSEEGGDRMELDSNLVNLGMLKKAEEIIKEEEPIPDVEWWDMPILADKHHYGDVGYKKRVKKEKAPQPLDDKEKAQRELEEKVKLESVWGAADAVAASDGVHASRLQDGEMDDVLRANGKGKEKEKEKEKEEEPIGRNIKDAAITHLIEHPYILSPPSEKPAPGPMPLKLTKAEQKKMRRRARAERLREQQERVLLGLEKPPPNRVRLSNMMKVMGTEAVQDPTQIEHMVRAEMEQRVRNHEARNQARKLTPAQKRLKKLRKLKEDTTYLTRVAVFKVLNLSDEKHRYKVDINAQENNLTGRAVLFGNCNLVLVEGGPKAILRYKKLMLRRIDWNSFLSQEEAEGEGGAEGGETKMETDGAPAPAKAKPAQPTTNNINNQCWLLWEGSVLKPAFREFRFEQVFSEKAARKLLKDRRVAQYWDCCKWGRASDAVKVELTVS